MKKLIKSFGYAINGIITTVKSERNMRIHTAFLFYVAAGGFIAQFSLTEWVSALLCIALVIGMEFINTALERMCDEVQKGYSENIKKAKDAAAGGVLVCAVISAVIGSALFFRREKLELIWNFICENTIIFAVLVLLLPIWLVFIFRESKKEDKKK